MRGYDVYFKCDYVSVMHDANVIFQISKIYVVKILNNLNTIFLLEDLLIWNLKSVEFEKDNRIATVQNEFCRIWWLVLYNVVTN